MRFPSITLLFRVSLILAQVVWSEPASSNPAKLPLPPQKGSSNPPPPGHKGVWVDDIGDTHAAYGDDRKHGIPKHAAHVDRNYNKHPTNDQPFPVNPESQEDKDMMRKFLIANKPTEEGKARDHKPPNVQALPGSWEDRKRLTTVHNLPGTESAKEGGLLGGAYRAAKGPGASGMIQVDSNKGKGPNSPTSSLGSSLKSIPGGHTKIPRPKKPAAPQVAPSPRRLRPLPGRPAPKAAAAAPPASPPVTPAKPQRATSHGGRPKSRIPVSAKRKAAAKDLPVRPKTPTTPTPAGKKGKRSTIYTLDGLERALARRWLLARY